MSNQDQDFTVGTETSYGLGKPEDGYPKTPPLTEELIRRDVDGAILHRHEWRRQKWEYKVEQYSFIIDWEDQAHMNKLGNEGWELVRQAEYEEPHRVVCTFKRPKVEDES